MRGINSPLLERARCNSLPQFHVATAGKILSQNRKHEDKEKSEEEQLRLTWNHC